MKTTGARKSAASRKGPSGNAAGEPRKSIDAVPPSPATLRSARMPTHPPSANWSRTRRMESDRPRAITLSVKAGLMAARVCVTMRALSGYISMRTFRPLR